MGSGEFVRLNCQSGVLDALASGLTAFGPTEGAPEWLVSGVWLCAADTLYLATASIHVLADGFVARGLCIGTPEDLLAQVDAELPDLASRLKARGGGLTLPSAVDQVILPTSLTPWPHHQYRMSVLVRACRPDADTNQVTCGLLFDGAANRRLLVGTDPSTLAMVLSDDHELIDRYRRGCVEFSPEDYRSLGDR